MPVNWGGELTGFMNGLQIASGIVDARSQRDYREQMGSYYGQQAEQAADVHAEWMQPESQAARMRAARAAADQAALNAQVTQQELDKSRYEFEEYSDPANRSRRARGDDLELDRQQQAADTARLVHQQEELKWIEASSPAARARREQAEQLIAEGNVTAGLQAAMATQKLYNDMIDFRKSQAEERIEQLQAQGKEIPDSLRIAAEASPIEATRFFDDFVRRHEVDPAEAAGVPQGALPVAGPQNQAPGAVSPGLTGGAPAAVPAAPATTGALGSNGLPDVGAVEAYIRQAATARGIDPDTAVAVARNEGLKPNTWQSGIARSGTGAEGGREASFGPYQLYMGGGLGNQFMQQTGLDPRDPSTWQQQVDFALDAAKQGGWTPWYGAANGGISRWAGINPNAPGVSPTAPPLATSSVSTSAPVMSPNMRPAMTPAVPASGTAPPPAPATTGSVEQRPPGFQQSVDEMAKVGNRRRYADAGMLTPAGVPTQDMMNGARQLYTGQGGADPAAQRARDDFIASWDYEQLPPSQRRLVNDIATYNYTKKKDPAKAEALAGELMRSRMTEASKYLAFAKAAVQAGDEAGAVTGIMRTLASVPNGVDADFRKQEDGDYLVTFVMNDGREVHREITNPDNLFSTIWGASPRDLDKLLYLFAGKTQPGPSEGMASQLNELQRNPFMTPNFSVLTGEGEVGQFLTAQKAAQDAAGVSVEDRSAIATDIEDIQDEIIGPAVAGMDPIAQEMVGQHLVPLTQITQRLMQANRQLGAGPAVSAMFSDMLKVDPQHPYDPTFSVTQDANGNPVQDAQGYVTVNTKTGPNMRMAPDDYAYVTARRDEIQNQLALARAAGEKRTQVREATGEELGRQLESGLPAFGETGEAPEQLTYDQFVELWERAHPPTGTMSVEGEWLEVDQSEQMQRDYETYLRQPRGASGR